MRTIYMAVIVTKDEEGRRRSWELGPFATRKAAENVGVHEAAKVGKDIAGDPGQFEILAKLLYETSEEFFADRVSQLRESARKKLTREEIEALRL